MKRTMTVTLDAPETLNDQRVADLIKKRLGGPDIFAIAQPVSETGPIIGAQESFALTAFDVTPIANEQFKDAIDQIRSILWNSADDWTPDKEWDSETIEHIARILDDLGVRPR